MKEAFDESFGIVPLLEKEGEFYLFLVRHKKSNFWGFPKGHKEQGEDDFSTAERELLEETGLKVLSYLHKEPFLEKYRFSHQGTIIHKQVSYFLAFTTEKFSLDNREIIEGRWVLLSEAESLATYQEGKSLCLAVASFLKKR